MYQLSNQGIRLDPMPDQVGEKCRITYEGLLKQCGADQVYLHCGFGSSWNNVQDLPMYNTANGCTCDVTMAQDGLFNFCFKDSANNWDNNNGSNWSFTIKR
ncbi:carbohydrate-binding protein [Candidatus Formimonas warabiya]|uniref:Carbohydrate binding module family 25 domain-containing protein n=1 Tax=Formimonas warabiya TaxID=1761012 RepID=A0A3G1KM07_FORW1|nr:carbohydrate-binding protein [Candidatus Formimonas warabiya]ATW23460.1 hypothetical protein DCMF_00395 [Candidatus Formimonas warabiya]